MLTREEFDNLAIGDLIEAAPLFKHLAKEPLVLRTLKIDGDSKIFVVTYFGVTIGRWTATLKKEEVQWQTH